MRGLRQGDPLSPYLFILIADVFSRPLSNAVQNGSVKALKMSRSCPLLSHLFFANDAMIFMEATEENVAAVLGVIADYCRASGQEVNLQKPSLIFSSKDSGIYSCTLGNTYQFKN